MTNDSPYEPPRSAIAPSVPTTYGEIRIFSAQGRLGRVRYIGYSVGLAILLNIVSGLLGGLIGTLVRGMQGAEWLAGAAFLIPTIGMVVIAVLLAIQRLHDFDASGWWAILVLVPVANLILYLTLLIMPGTQGPNRFGYQPPPNTKLAIILSLILPLIIVLILAAVAIPSYHNYVQRAQQMNPR